MPEVGAMKAVNWDGKRAYVPTGKPSGTDIANDVTGLADALITSFATAFNEAPAWWSRSRDNWMSKFWKMEGNDLLAGATSTLVAKVASTNWYVEGPERIAHMYRDIFLNQSDWGAGWDSWIQKWVLPYLVRDFGGLSIRHRTSASDLEGPSFGFSHVDESKCLLTGDPDFPVAYERDGKLVKLRREFLMRLVDMPSPEEKNLGVGFCSLSRAISTATILRMVVKYKMERLSDLPPAAILFISNLTKTQWDDIVTKYDTRQRQEGNTVWRDLLVAFGFDPDNPVTTELFELSSLPEHYDEKTATEIAVYTFALAFRVDPREYWPVSSGPLGTAHEAEIMHKKAKAKGPGIIFNAIEHHLNDPLSLPEAVRFKFDYQDDEEDLQRNQIQKLVIDNIRRMYEPTQSVQFRPGAPPEEEPGRPDREEEALRQVEMELEERGGGLITREEARLLLAREGVIPSEWVEGSQKIERLYDVRTYGRYSRVYRDGRVIPV